jgi:hypothetical protein
MANVIKSQRGDLYGGTSDSKVCIAGTQTYFATPIFIAFESAGHCIILKTPFFHLRIKGLEGLVKRGTIVKIR